MSIRSSLLLQCLSRPGPSRLANRLHPCSSCLRRSASTTSDSHTPSEPPVESTPSPDAAAEADASATQSSTAEPQEEAAPGFKAWLKEIGYKYRDPPEKGPNWLGGNETPFPSNPSFRPPTPLSDMLREMIYMDSLPTAPLPFLNPKLASGQLRGAAKSIPQLSEKYGISKARVEAVLKLKAMEKEWEREGKTLQIPFNDGMEKYLAVRLPRPRTSPNVSSLRTEQAELAYRSLHPSSTLETAEEAQHEQLASEHGASDAEMHDGTVFSKRDTAKAVPGLERIAWELRGEDAGEEPMASPYDPSVVEEGQEGKETEMGEVVSRTAKSTRGTFRFIDVGKQPHLAKELLEGKPKTKRVWKTLKKMEKTENAKKDMLHHKSQ